MHIVIVGGGTAGWLTAILGLAATEHQFTVIESTRLGIIGVGESTTGFFTDLFQHDLRNLGISHDDFMIRTGATVKLGIRHRGWSGPDSDYFGPLDGSDTQFDVPDQLIEYALNMPNPRDRITVSHTGYLIRHGLSNMQHSQFRYHGHSMHVDGTLTGQYFRDCCLRNPQCQWIDGEVTGLKRNDQGNITELILEGGRTVPADLFIDCTGFARRLITEMGAKWVSYRDHLPVDRGMPFLENYKPNEIPQPWTTAWAQQHGWLWQTPLLDRRGNGYVYSSSHCSDDQAQREIESLLGRPITPVKFIKFEAGRQDRAWINNCVSIGLSSSFLEPLEATSIHTTICQIKMLFREYIGTGPEQTLTPGIQATYNRRWSQQMDDLRDFLVMHYQGGRTDSEFWRWISSGATRTDRVRELIDMAQHRIPTFNDFPRYWGVAGWSLYCWIMMGLGLLDKVKTNQDFEHTVDLEIKYQLLQKKLSELYGQNLSHKEYIEHFQRQRQSYKSYLAQQTRS